MPARLRDAISGILAGGIRVSAPRPFCLAPPGHLVLFWPAVVSRMTCSGLGTQAALSLRLIAAIGHTIPIVISCFLFLGFGVSQNKQKLHKHKPNKSKTKQKHQTKTRKRLLQILQDRCGLIFVKSAKCQETSVVKVIASYQRMHAKSDRKHTQVWQAINRRCKV